MATATKQRPSFLRLVEGGRTGSSGRHSAPEERGVRVGFPQRSRWFGTAELELIPNPSATSDLLISLPLVAIFGLEQVRPAVRKDGTPRVYVEIGGLRVVVRSVEFSRNWLHVRVAHPDGTGVSNLLTENERVFLYWVAESGAERVVTLQAQGSIG